MTIHTITQAKNANARAGFHWFEPASMRFFGSRLPRTVIPVADGALFVSSEQRPFIPGVDETQDPRRYTIRFIADTGHVTTLGEFCAYASNDEAKRVAKAVAATWGAGRRVDAVSFFYDAAGFSHRPGENPDGARLLNAAVLARAEAYARVTLDFTWEHDDDDTADGDDTPVTREGCIARTKTHGVVMHSLWSIADATDNSRRVVEAELAAEVLDARGTRDMPDGV